MKLRHILTFVFLLSAFASFGANTPPEMEEPNTLSRSFNLFSDMLDLLVPEEDMEDGSQSKDKRERQPVTIARVTSAITDPILEMLWIKDTEEGGRIPIYLIYLGIPLFLGYMLYSSAKSEKNKEKRDKWALIGTGVSALFLFFLFYNVLGVVFIFVTYNYYLQNLRGDKCSKCSKYKSRRLNRREAYDLLEPKEQKALDSNLATVAVDECSACGSVSINLTLADDCSLCPSCDEYMIGKREKIVKRQATTTEVGLSVTIVTCPLCKATDEIENGIPKLSTYSNDTYTYTGRANLYDFDDKAELRREREYSRRLERELERERVSSSSSRSSESSGIGSIVKSLLPVIPGMRSSSSNKSSSSSSSSSRGGGSSSGGGSRSSWGGRSRGGGSSSGGGSKSGW